MSEERSGASEGATFWHVLKELLHLNAPSTLRESIEEAIEEHAGDGGAPGDLDPDERVMLRNMLQLGVRKAGDIAVPRSDMVAIADDSPFQTLIQTFKTAGHSRVPVYHQSLDDVIGMLHVKDVYGFIVEHLDRSARPIPAPAIPDLLRHVLFVPPSMPLVELLTLMRRKRTHMAVLVDEYGGTDGLITIEDVVEEIVGDIEDEHDETEPEQIIRRPDGSIEADAMVELEDLEEALGAGFVDDELGSEVETLGGLTVQLAERIPERGEVFHHPNGWTIEVLASNSRRVRRLRLLPPAAANDPA